jgi:hypothetical protein
MNMGLFRVNFISIPTAIVATVTLNISSLIF